MFKVKPGMAMGLIRQEQVRKENKENGQKQVLLNVYHARKAERDFMCNFCFAKFERKLTPGRIICCLVHVCTCVLCANVNWTLFPKRISERRDGGNGQMNVLRGSS